MQDVAALHRLVDASEEEEARFLNVWIFLRYRLERSPRNRLLNIKYQFIASLDQSGAIFVVRRIPFLAV